MVSMNRRSFLQYSAGVIAAAGSYSKSLRADSPALKATALHAIGNTGLSCSYLGFGTGTRGRGPGITDLTLTRSGEEIVSLLQYAYERGITYFDLADRYGSHHHMRLAMQRSIPREKVLLLSKVWSREPNRVKTDLERFREELDTDCIDIVLMHCLRQGEEDWPETLRPVMDLLSEAKAQGKIKAHGVSCHVLPALERVAGEPWCDVVLARINPFGVNMDGPVETITPILQKIHDAGKGVLGMKILGEGKPEVVAKMDESFKFIEALGSIHAITVGFMNKEQLDEVMGRINA